MAEESGMQLPYSRSLRTGAAVVLSAVLIGVVAFAYATSEKTPASVSGAQPSKFPGVRVQVGPVKKQASTPKHSAPAAGSEIHIDRDGNRIVPDPSDITPAEHPELRSAGKTGFSYEEHDIPGGLKKVVPSSPIRTLSVLEIDEEGNKKLDCLTLSESAIEGLAVRGAKEGVAE